MSMTNYLIRQGAMTSTPAHVWRSIPIVLFKDVLLAGIECSIYVSCSLVGLLAEFASSVLTEIVVAHTVVP